MAHNEANNCKKTDYGLKPMATDPTNMPSDCVPPIKPFASLPLRICYKCIRKMPKTSDCSKQSPPPPVRQWNFSPLFLALARCTALRLFISGHHHTDVVRQLILFPSYNSFITFASVYIIPMGFCRSTLRVVVCSFHLARHPNLISINFNVFIGYLIFCLLIDFIVSPPPPLSLPLTFTQMWPIIELSIIGR